MTKIQAEQILSLTNTPGWKTFIELKNESLAQRHLELEYAKGEAAASAQGQIIEIRNDLGLQKRAAGLLNG